MKAKTQTVTPIVGYTVTLASGVEAVVTEISSGWFTCKDADGNVSKSRASKLTCTVESVDASADDAPETEAEDGEVLTGAARMSGQLRKYAKGYVAGKTADGSRSLNCGDQVAQDLNGCTLDEVYRVVSKQLGETQKALKEKYAHLNPGSTRMTLGNRYRASVKREATEA